MSAFTVQADHIDLLATAAVVALQPHPSQWADLADKTGATLWAENYASVNYRYRESEPVPAYSWTPVLELMSAPRPAHWIQVLSALSVYRYQACERPDYSDSLAEIMCCGLEAHCMRMLADWPTRKNVVGDLEPVGIHNDGGEWDRSKGFTAALEVAAELKL